MKKHLTISDISRRKFINITLASTFCSKLLQAQNQQFRTPMTGKTVQGLEAFDEMMHKFILENKVPGASLSLGWKGKLIYNRGFGFANVEDSEKVKPDALFRIASVSKPITATAVLQLVERGLLKLSDRVVGKLALTPFLLAGTTIDARWDKITVEHCLQHIGGWDRGVSYDPIVRHRQIAKTLGIDFPVSSDDIIKYMMGKPLDFDPGTKYAYSNLGYLILGRLIEVVSGMTYEKYVRHNIFKPLKLNKPRLASALEENRAIGEVRYYDQKNRKGKCVYPPRVGEEVPIQYGYDNIEAYGAHGGWICSTADLVVFANAFSDPKACPLLSEASINRMWKNPDYRKVKADKDKERRKYYGLGWEVYDFPRSPEINTWHSGYIPGSESELVRRWDGLTWAVLFNTAFNQKQQSLVGLIDQLLHKTSSKVKRWPTG